MTSPIGPAWTRYSAALPATWPFRLSAPWRQEVQRTRIVLLCDLLRLDLKDEQEQERAFLIGQLLEDANTATTERVNAGTWWWGTQIERAWARLHEVGERTVDLVPNHELCVRAAFASQRGTRYLPRGDKRLEQLEALRLQSVAAPAQPPVELRSAIVEVLRATTAQSDRTMQEARAFRNRLLMASIFSVSFAAILVLVQVSLRATSLVYPPTDWRGPAWAFLIAVMFFGCVGALFTAIPTMSQVPADFSPFNLPIQQALLKITFGPLVALVGLAVLSTGAPEIGPPTTWPALLIFAVVFGAAQHVVTRYVDHRANAILSAIAPDPSKTAT